MWGSGPIDQDRDRKRTRVGSRVFTAEQGAAVRNALRTVAERLRPLADSAVRTLSVAVGVVSLALAAALVTGVGGDRSLSYLPEAALFSEWSVGALGVAAGAVALWALARVRSDEPGGLELPDPAATDDLRNGVTGADFDSKVSRYGNAPETAVSWYDRDVHNRLADLAVAVLSEHTEADRAAAEATLADGTWTTDPRAKAYFADEGVLPLRIRLVDWANGDRYGRQVDAVVDELADRAGVETDPSLRADGPAGEPAAATSSDRDEYETTLSDVVRGGSDGGGDREVEET